MKVGELKELLEEYEDDQVIFLAHQPSWPLCLNIGGVASWGDRERECPDHEGYVIDHDPECVAAHEDDVDHESETADEKVVWLIGGDHPYDRSPYAPRWLWDGEGWRWWATVKTRSANAARPQAWT